MARRKKTKKKIDKKRLRKQYGENFDVFEQAIDNGVIVKMQELVYPIFILPGAFAVGGQQKTHISDICGGETTAEESA